MPTHNTDENFITHAAINWAYQFCGIRIGYLYDPDNPVSFPESPKTRARLVIQQHEEAPRRLSGLLQLFTETNNFRGLNEDGDIRAVSDVITALLGFGLPVDEHSLQISQYGTSVIEKFFGVGTKASLPHLKEGCIEFYSKTVAVGRIMVLHRFDVKLPERLAMIQLVASTVAMPPEWSFPGRWVDISNLEGFWLPDLRDIVNQGVLSTCPELTSSNGNAGANSKLKCNSGTKKGSEQNGSTHPVDDPPC